MTNELTIVVNTRLDYFLAKDCILSIAKVYENLEKPNIVLITDGIDFRDLKDWCEFNKINYLKGERLYLINKGGQWVKRWLEQGIKYNTEWILRLDPDTRLFKPVPLKHEKNIDVISPYFPEDERLTRLHGSFQLIRKESALMILESNILDDEKYKKTEFEFDYNANISERSRFKINTDRSVCVSEDLIFSDVCKSLNFNTKNASYFINCWWREKPSDEFLLENPVAQHPYYNILNLKRRVFGVGLSKTGTTALNDALNMIGVDSVHYNNNLKTNEDVFKCIQFFEGYVDSPMPLIFKDVDKLYPGSSFILTVRDVKEWVDSLKFYIKKWIEMQERTNNIISDEMRENRLKIKQFIDDYHNKIFGLSLYDNIDNPKLDYILSYTYNKHCLDVIEYFENRKDLLILDVSKRNSFIDLANFLNTAAPTRNIPVKNNRIEVVNFIKDMEKAIFRNHNQRKKLIDENSHID